VAAGRTQVQLARSLGWSQSTLSAVEAREDTLLSTIARYVDALGGRLTLRVAFANATVDFDSPLLNNPARLRAAAKKRGGKHVS
jgi:hypothetical protein